MFEKFFGSDPQPEPPPAPTKPKKWEKPPERPTTSRTSSPESKPRERKETYIEQKQRADILLERNPAMKILAEKVINPESNSQQEYAKKELAKMYRDAGYPLVAAKIEEGLGIYQKDSFGKDRTIGDYNTK